MAAALAMGLQMIHLFSINELKVQKYYSKCGLGRLH